MGTLGVGAALRDARIRKRLSLYEIACQTKIPERSLSAIESDDFDALPGIVFTRSFVRQYASAVGLDPDPLLSLLPRYDLQSAPLPEPSVRRARLPDPRGNSAIATVAWALLAVGAAGTAYLHFNRGAGAAKVQAKSPAPANVIPRQQPKSQPAPPVVVPAADTHPVNVVVKALADSWVQLTADGKIVFAGVIKAGESQTAGAHDLVKILVGNAGGVQVSLNGKTLAPLGSAGEVRTLRLTAEGPQSDPKNQPLSRDPI